MCIRDSLTIPKPAYKTDGLNTKGNTKITSQGNLGVFTNVRGKNVALVSTEGSTTVGSGTVRHHWGENYHDTLVRTHIEATDNLLIQGHKGAFSLSFLIRSNPLF